MTIRLIRYPVSTRHELAAVAAALSGVGVVVVVGGQHFDHYEKSDPDAPGDNNGGVGGASIQYSYSCAYHSLLRTVASPTTRGVQKWQYSLVAVFNITCRRAKFQQKLRNRGVGVY